MYTYSPKSEKKLEKVLFAGTVVLAVLLFSGSKIPGMPYPVVLQTLAFMAIVFAIMLISKYLIVGYSYSIEEGASGERELKITQRSGKRLRVVCRVPLSAISQKNVMTAENKKALRAQRKSRMIYHYIDEMSPERALLLDVCFGGEDFCLLIFADQTLETLLLAS